MMRRGVDHMMSAETLQRISPNVRLIEQKIKQDGEAKEFDLELWHCNQEVKELRGMTYVDLRRGLYCGMAGGDRSLGRRGG